MLVVGVSPMLRDCYDPLNLFDRVRDFNDLTDSEIAGRTVLFHYHSVA